MVRVRINLLKEQHMGDHKDDSKGPSGGDKAKESATNRENQGNTEKKDSGDGKDSKKSDR